MQSGGRNGLIRRLISAGLLAVLAGINVAPLGSLFPPTGPCECGCSHPGQECCCRSPKKEMGSGGASWSALARCDNNCRCAAGLTSHFRGLTLARWGHRLFRTQTTVLGSLAATAPLGGGNPGYLAFLHQRPPPSS